MDFEDYDPPPIKLEKYGKMFTKRFYDPKSTLHPEQIEALKAIVGWFSIHSQTKDSTAMVVMPTGTGKTGVICCLPYVLGNAVSTHLIDIDLSKPILVIAPNLEILYQLEESISCTKGEPFLMKIGLIESKDVKNRVYYQVYTVKETRDVIDLDQISGQCEIVLANAQKFRKVNGKDHKQTNFDDLKPDLFSVVMVDEAHHLPAEQWSNIVKKFKKHAKIIFFTATPYRSDGKSIIPDEPEQQFTYELKRQTAVDRTLIRNIQWTCLTQENGERRIMKDVLQKVKSTLDEKNLNQELPERKKHSAIVITGSINDANLVNEIWIHDLEFDPSKVKEVHGEAIGSDEKKRRNVIDQIKEGAFEMVIIVGMLLEGFDYPPFSVAGIVTKITSPVKFAQFIGRVQRKVRVKTERGFYKESDEIKGDIITHEFYRQQERYEYYLENS